MGVSAGVRLGSRPVVRKAFDLCDHLLVLLHVRVRVTVELGVEGS